METVLSGLWLLLKIVVSIVVFASAFLTIFGLPGNFIILIIAAVYFLVTGAFFEQLLFLGVLLLMAGAGEFMEFGASALVAKKTDTPRPVFIVAVVSGVFGAFIGAPLFFGIGAVVFSLAGVFLGALFMQYRICGDWDEARETAVALFLGNLGGKFVKIMIGIPMAALVVYRVFA